MSEVNQPCKFKKEKVLYQTNKRKLDDLGNVTISCTHEGIIGTKSHSQFHQNASGPHTCACQLS